MSRGRGQSESGQRDNGVFADEEIWKKCSCDDDCSYDRAQGKKGTRRRGEIGELNEESRQKRGLKLLGGVFHLLDTLSVRSNDIPTFKYRRARRRWVQVAEYRQQ